MDFRRIAAAFAGLHALALLMQPVLAGMILGGSDLDALAVHLWNGRLVVGAATLTLGAFAIAWRRGQARPRWMVAALALVVAEIVQFFLGYSANLLVHIPLGTAIVASGAVLAFAAWRRRPEGPGQGAEPGL